MLTKIRKSLERAIHDWKERCEIDRMVQERNRLGFLYAEGNLGIFPKHGSNPHAESFDTYYNTQTYAKMIKNASEKARLHCKSVGVPRIEFLAGNVGHGYLLWNVSQKESGRPIVALLGCEQDRGAYSNNLGFRAYSDFLPRGLCNTRVFPGCEYVARIENSDLRMFLMSLYEEMEINSKFGR